MNRFGNCFINQEILFSDISVLIFFLFKPIVIKYVIMSIGNVIRVQI